MNELNNLLSKMESISLEEMDKVRLMNRIDVKYVFHKAQLNSILEACTNDYFIFNISGNLHRTYLTSYFDTADLKMYRQHHNGKLNRYKIRERVYADTGDKFIELKFKSNRNVTKKRRLKIENLTADKQKVIEFVKNRTAFDFTHLHKSIKNKFTRITLVSKKLDERVTIDFGLLFLTKSGTFSLPDLVIIEQKKQRTVKQTVLSSILNEKHIISTGFSKYCMGIILTNTNVKANRFKQKLRYLKKLRIETEFVRH